MGDRLGSGTVLLSTVRSIIILQDESPARAKEDLKRRGVGDAAPCQFVCKMTHTPPTLKANYPPEGAALTASVGVSMSQ